MKNKENLIKNKTRTNLINYLISTRDYKRYLEIGVDNSRLNYDKIRCNHKTSVDPNPKANADYIMTSDEFFCQNNKKYDIIFIDGLHLHEQVIKDIDNSLKCINDNGTIVIHDCLPKQKQSATRIHNVEVWNGDVWKGIMYVRMNYDNLFFYTLNMDYGCGIIEPFKNQKLYSTTPLEDMDWDFYISNKDNAFNITEVEDWLHHEESSKP